MPHLTLEYTDNLHRFDPQAALHLLNRALADSGQFDEVDIKSRALRLDAYLVGTAGTPRAFVHATLALLDGRTAEIKQTLSQRLLAVLQTLCPHPHDAHLQLTVEIRDMDRASYAKAGG